MSDFDLLMRRLFDSGLIQLANDAEALAGTGDGLMTSALVAKAIVGSTDSILGMGFDVVDIVFTTSGTYNKHPDAVVVFVEGWGSGASGQAIARADYSTGANYASGGNGGWYNSETYLASELASSVEVVVGAETVSPAASNANVAASLPGSDSRFGNLRMRGAVNLSVTGNAFAAFQGGWPVDSASPTGWYSGQQSMKGASAGGSVSYGPNSSLAAAGLGAPGGSRGGASGDGAIERGTGLTARGSDGQVPGGGGGGAVAIHATAANRSVKGGHGARGEVRVREFRRRKSA